VTSSTSNKDVNKNTCKCKECPEQCEVDPNVAGEGALIRVGLSLLFLGVERSRIPNQGGWNNQKNEGATEAPGICDE
jgi:hypothetical protein